MRCKRILLVDDNAVVRQTVREIIEENPAWKICGEGENGKAAIELARKLHPDIVVLDFRMPAMNGLQAAERIRGFAPQASILLFTSDSSPKLVRRARDCGVRKVICKAGGGYLQLLDCLQQSEIPQAPVHHLKKRPQSERTAHRPVTFKRSRTNRS
jgi:DNA-binding NarL/FixJ family response regulator